EPAMDGYFGWVAGKGFDLPPNRTDIWMPEGEDAVPGPSARPSRIPADLSDSAYFTDRGLAYLKGRRDGNWFLHLGYYRPHPQFIAPSPYNAMYDAADMPSPVRAASAEEEARQHPLLAFYVNNIGKGSFFQNAKGLARDMTDAEVR